MNQKRHPLALSLAMLCSLFGATAYAQDVPRIEVGVHATAIRLGSFRLQIPGFDETQRGFGGRVTVNVTEHFSVEGEANIFPKDFRLNVKKLSGVLMPSSRAVAALRAASAAAPPLASARPARARQ